MSFKNEFRRIRQHSLLTQEDLAKEIKVAFSTVNRWECGKTKPNLSAMKKIKAFCDMHEVEYKTLEEEWLNM